ncbi:MAG: FecR domain-containing protein, partial [Candidatus Hydrogenedentes bacterium]|nr:FecR domain-containing protein [Candidatus Hydrogenedentota bacterium]
MKTATKKRTTGWASRARLPLSIVVAAVFAAAVATADDLLHARVSYDSGGALVKGSEDADWSYASVNTLILPGDTVWVDQEGVLEVEMSGGSFLRLADQSKAEIDQLPPSANVLAWTGSFYVQRVNRSTGDFFFRTPAARIGVDKDTQVRIDVVGDGATTVSVRWGRAVVSADGGAPVAVTSGYRVFIDPGLLPSEPMPFDRSAEDSFDSWNRERAKTLALGDTAIPDPIRNTTPIGYSDLNSYGEWVYVDNRTYWRPTVVTEYVPYRSGYWSYVPSYGYTWVGSYPFCYTTSHYGRWTYNSGYGWLWCYDPVWSPAWAVTVRYGDNFVWAPLDLYDRPVYYGGASFTVGDVRISIGASSYCSVNSLLYYGPTATYPAYSTIFNGVNNGEINIWNINIGNSYRAPLPDFGSSALVRDYSPQRVIRGLTGGTSTRLAASERVSRLESSVNRVRFASDAGTSVRGNRSVRTAIDDASRGSRVRSARVESSATQDPRSLVRRGERTTATLRELDGRPEGSRLREARSIRSGSSDAPSSPAASAPRTSSGRTLRNTDAENSGGIWNRMVERDEDAGRRMSSIRERVTTRTDSDTRSSGAASTSERTPIRSLTRADRQPQEASRPDFSRVTRNTERSLPQNAGSTNDSSSGRSGLMSRTPTRERSTLGSMSLPSRAQSRTETSARTDSERTSPRIATPPARTESPSSRTGITRTPAERTLPTPRASSPSRSETPRSISTPQRTESPRIASTPNQTSAPRVTTPSPRSSAPNISRNIPNRDSSPRVSVPQAPSRSIQRPSAAPQTRSIERPSVQAPSRSIQRPSVAPQTRSIERPSIQAPSRSIERP